MQSRLQRALTQRMFVFKREQKDQYHTEFQGKMMNGSYITFTKETTLLNSPRKYRECMFLLSLMSCHMPLMQEYYDSFIRSRLRITCRAAALIMLPDNFIVNICSWFLQEYST